MSRLVPFFASIIVSAISLFSLANLPTPAHAQADPRALGTLIPATDADLADIVRAAEILATSNSACDSARAEEQCVLVDCSPRADAVRRVDEALALLQGMEPWLTKARKAALAHYINLMNATIAAGDRQAYLEYWHAHAKYLQDLGKMTLAVLDLANFAKNFRADSANLKSLLADPTTSGFASALARVDHIDSMIGAFQNTADIANTLAGSFRERGEPIPQWVSDLSTLKQGASDMKNASRGFLEAASLMREADMLRRHATTIADAAEKARFMQQAADNAARAKIQWSNMRQAILQLIGKVLVAYSESQLAEMQGEIDELKANMEAELLPIQQAWLDWQRLSIRTDSLFEAIGALESAKAGMGACMTTCPAGEVSPPPSPPSFTGPPNADGTPGQEHWGDALRWYQARLAEAGAALSSASWAGEPGISPSYPPLIAPGGGEVAGGSEISIEADVDQCTAHDGEMMVGDKSIPFGGETHPVVTFPVPSTEGPVNVTIRRPGHPDMSVPTDYVSTGGGGAGTEEICGAINCDCDNLDFGILTGPYRDECRGAEAALIRECTATGRISGTCHPTASGPNPYPE